MTTTHRLFVPLLLTFVTDFIQSNNDEHLNQNVIIFIANDLGFSDLSCFGNDLIKTRNIDNLAERGLKFTRMYSMPSDVGSMAALVTGRHPYRLGLAKGTFGWQNFWSVAQSGGIPSQDMNLGKFFQMKGRSAFFFGRWELGSWSSSLPSNQGFGGFYGTVMGHNPGCSSDVEDRLSDSDYFWMIIQHNGPLAITFLIMIFTSKMLSFISMKFLVLLIIILGMTICVIRMYCWLLPLNSSTCKVLENQVVREQLYNDTNLTLTTTEKAIHYLKYRKTLPFLLIVSYHQPGHPTFASESFRGKSGINKYYDSILELDWSVGEIIKTLNEQGLGQDTVTIFLSDNGPVLTHPFMDTPVKHSSKMKTLRGEKFSLMEGGLRIPAIISWPRNIPPNQETSVVTSIMDIFPTLSHITGGPSPHQIIHMKQFDGKNLYPLFSSPNKPADEMYKSLLHYCDVGDLSAASVGDFKVYFVSHNKSNDCSGGRLENPLIYNIVDDPGETTPLPLKLHQDVISKALSTAVRFEISLDIKKSDIVSQFDQIPFPWHMWVSS